LDTTSSVTFANITATNTLTMVGTLTNYMSMYIEPDSDVGSITSIGSIRTRSEYGFVTVEANNGQFVVYPTMYLYNNLNIANSGYLGFTDNSIQTTAWTGYQRVDAAATTATSTASGIIFITDNGGRAAYYNTTATQWLYIGTDAVVYTPPSGPYDPYYSSLVFLLESSVNGDVTGNITPTIGFTQSATEVLYSNTCSWYANGGDWSRAANAAIAQLHSGNWTLDWWMWNSSSNTAENAVMNWNSSFQWRHEYDGNWHFYNFKDGIYPAPFGNPTTSAWTHIAMERDGGNFNFYINGTKVYTAGTSMYVDAGTMYFATEDGGSKFWTGYMDYMRLTTVARYGGSNFIPPTSDAAYGPAP
jgi:hypothetical protein